jgi:hypothetical protein
MTQAAIYNFFLDYGISFIGISSLVFFGILAFILYVVFPRVSVHHSKHRHHKNDTTNH